MRESHCALAKGLALKRPLEGRLKTFKRHFKVF
jgi:hypothetical protein